MQHKQEHLHIRASEHEKAIIAEAALAKNMSVSQFVLSTTVPAAEEIVRREAGEIPTLFRLDAASWEEFDRLLDEPPRDLPALRALLFSNAPWEA